MRIRSWEEEAGAEDYHGVGESIFPLKMIGGSIGHVWYISSRIDIAVGILIPTDLSGTVYRLDVFAQGKTKNVAVSSAAVSIWLVVYHVVENIQHPRYEIGKTSKHLRHPRNNLVVE